jgi:hypothetical protein
MALSVNALKITLLSALIVQIYSIQIKQVATESEQNHIVIF